MTARQHGVGNDEVTLFATTDHQRRRGQLDLLDLTLEFHAESGHGTHFHGRDSVPEIYQRSTPTSWRVELAGVSGRPVYVEGEPRAGDFAYDRGRYYLIRDVRPSERLLVLQRREDTAAMRKLRRPQLERFRRIPLRVLE